MPIGFSTIAHTAKKAINLTMIKLYGIPNCQTVKKAQTWLKEQGIAFEFIDFKKSLPTEILIRTWLKDVPLEILLNKKGTTWRKLTPEEQAKAGTEAGAIELMCAHPSLIKRPVLVAENLPVSVGFSETQYHAMLLSQP